MWLALCACVTEMTAPVKEEEWTGPPFYMRDLAAIWVEVKGTGGVGPASRAWGHGRLIGGVGSNEWAHVGGGLAHHSVPLRLVDGC
jgi:hypothetical protein